MDYFDVVKRALTISWQHKALWLFGFIQALFSGGSFRVPSGDFSTRPEIDRFPVSEASVLDQLLTPAVLVFMIFLVFFIVILAIVGTNLSRAALVGMVKEVEDSGATGVRNGFRIGFRGWFKVFLQSLVIWAPYTVALIVVGGVLAVPPVLAFLAESTVLGIVLAVISVLLFVGLVIITAIPLALISQLALRYLVLEDSGIIDAVGRGYRLFRSNLGRVFLMWLILLVIGASAGVAILMIGLIFLVPAIILAMINLWLLIPLVVPALLILAFFSGLVQVFTSTTWTLMFLKLREGEGPAPVAPGPQYA